MSSLAIITGASSGIGEAFAYQLAADHDEIWLIGRRQKELNQVAQRLEKQFSTKAEVIILDLANTDNIEKLAERIQSASHLRTLVNNAGYSCDGAFHSMPWKDHRNLMNVHVEATLRLSYAGLQIMAPRAKGQIINVASVASWMPTPTSPLYGPTKAFIRSFSESLAAAYAHTDIRIQALCPGFTVTDFHSRMGLDPKKFYKSRGLMKSWSSEYTVRESLADLRKNHVICVPGYNYKLLAYLIRIIPNKILARVSQNRSHRRGIEPGKG